MKVQFDVVLNLDDSDAPDIGEGGKAAEPGKHLPADSGGGWHHRASVVQRKGKESDEGLPPRGGVCDAVFLSPFQGLISLSADPGLALWAAILRRVAAQSLPMTRTASIFPAAP